MVTNALRIIQFARFSCMNAECTHEVKNNDSRKLRFLHRLTKTHLRKQQTCPNPFTKREKSISFAGVRPVYWTWLTSLGAMQLVVVIISCDGGPFNQVYAVVISVNWERHNCHSNTWTRGRAFHAVARQSATWQIQFQRNIFSCGKPLQWLLCSHNIIYPLPRCTVNGAQRQIPCFNVLAQRHGYFYQTLCCITRSIKISTQHAHACAHPATFNETVLMNNLFTPSHLLGSLVSCALNPLYLHKILWNMKIW